MHETSEKKVTFRQFDEKTLFFIRSLLILSKRIIYHMFSGPR
jgi:hypothetical protein